MSTKKVLFFFNVITTYQNWWRWIAYRLGRFKPKEECVMRLRNGLIFSTVPAQNEPGTIDDVFIRNEYGAYTDAIPQGGVVIDIGANIGAFSLAVARAVPDVTILSYEPSPDTFKRLLKNVAQNNMSHSVRVHNRAVAGEKGERMLAENQNNSGLASFVFGRDGTELKPGWVSSPTKTTALPDIFTENTIAHCDFLKMDCEGAEFEIIAATPDVVLSKIGFFALEYHGDPRPIVQRLETLGFRVSGYEPGSTLGILWAQKMK